MALDEFFSRYGGKEFPLPDIAGQYEGKNIVVCGDAACIWEDLEKFGCRLDEGRGKVFKDGWDFMVVNKLGETFPGDIEHWYSNESHLLKKFVQSRRSEYSREFKPPEHLHSRNPGVNWRWPFGGHGSSGLGATLAAIGMGYSQIVICGMPLNNQHHNGEPHWRECRFEFSEVRVSPGTGINKHWQNAIELAFDGKVRSMSGRIRTWLES